MMIAVAIVASFKEDLYCTDISPTVHDELQIFLGKFVSTLTEVNNKKKLLVY
jgi:hypothetical protein